MNFSEKYKPRLVFITSRFPFPLEKGDKLRAYYQIKELADDFEIYLISTPEKPVSQKSIHELNNYCKSIHIFPIHFIQKIIGMGIKVLGQKPIQVGYFHHYSIQKKIDRLLKEIQPHHIYCQLIRSAEYVKNHHQCPKTIDYMDAFSKGMERRANTSSFFIKRWFFKNEYQRLLKYENSIFEYFEHHTIISKQDRNYIFHKHRNKIHIIANGISDYFLKDMIPPTKKEADLVFIGNMAYSPNVAAAKFIANQLLPLLPKSIKIKIAGASPTREVRRLSSPQIEITGYVEDIRRTYQSAQIFIAPMFIGTGLQNKLLEAMALKVPCITTQLVNNALGATPGKDLLIADTAEDMAEKITSLLNNKEEQIKLTKNGRKFVAEHYNWKSVTQPLKGLLTD